MKKGILFALAASLAVYSTVCWIGTGILLMPPRKPPQNWQREMLENPEHFGLRIIRGTSEAGVPYLLCTPDAQAGPGHRGDILRHQLGRLAPPYGETAGTIVLLHGWGMRKESLLAVAERFCAAGQRCVIPDLPGHGESPQPTAGFGARDCESLIACEVLRSAARRFGFSAHPAVLWGLSMGGAYALQAAAAEPARWEGVIVVSSFDALCPVIHGRVDALVPGAARLLHPGLSLAVRWRGGFWPSKACPVFDAGRLRIPAFVLHGTADDLIPCASGRRLFAALPPERKTWLAVEGALHGNVLGTPQRVFREMCAWILARHPAASPPQLAKMPRSAP